MIHCPNCQSTQLIYQGSGQTCMNFSSFTDENKYMHHHDKNHAHKEYKCVECGNGFRIPHYNSCWCGWTNEHPDQTFTLEENYAPFKVFKYTPPVITNNEWINNLKVALGSHDFPTSNKSTQFPD
jgi:hypothetical protein